MYIGEKEDACRNLERNLEEKVKLESKDKQLF